MRRRVPLLITLCMALLGGGASPAHAVPIVFGSNLQETANLPFGCELRPYTTPTNGVAQLIPTGQTSCMWWQSGVSAASTYVPRGLGVVVGARVKTGDNPAPLRISIISSGAGGFCCTQQTRSDVFQPAPNAITTVPLNLAAGSGIDPNRQGGQYNDIAVVTAVGPGSLPVHDTQVHNTFNLAAPWANFLHPELTNNNTSLDVGTMDGFEVLLQVLWCGNPGTGSTATGARASADPDELKAYRAQAIDCPAPAGATATPNPGGGGGGAGNAGSSSGVKAARLSAPVSKGRARVRLTCANGCTGTMILRRRGTKVQLGKKTAFSAGAGQQPVIRVPLTTTGKAAVRRRATVAADAVVTLSGVAKPLKLAISLKR
ncbi:MAG: hypothetical protein J7513_02670 [Solirubrobacteraceae bacterium]|nr:hypothetical protein [Solirubrobacteraceae bacterium]